MISILFGTATLAAAVRLAVPLIFASVGGSFGDRAGIFNIALESFMLCAAFAAAWGCWLYASPFIGLLFGMAAGLICALVFGVFVFHLGSSGMVVSIAMNTGAWGLTTLLLSSIFNTRGFFMDSRLTNLPSLDIPLLRSIPYLSDILNNQNVLVYVSFIAVVLMWALMYKTPFGLRLRGVGINEKAAQTTGTNVTAYKWYSVLITGVFMGFSGAFLSIGGSAVFSENMSAGRGFLAVAAIIISKGNPLKAMLTSLLFAYAEALTIALQNLGVPSQLVLTLPYVATVVILTISAWTQLANKRRKGKQKTQVSEEVYKHD